MRINSKKVEEALRDIRILEAVRIKEFQALERKVIPELSEEQKKDVEAMLILAAEIPIVRLVRYLLEAMVEKESEQEVSGSEQQT